MGHMQKNVRKWALHSENDRKNIHSAPWTKGGSPSCTYLQPQSLTSKNAIDRSRAETNGGQIPLVVLHIDVGHCGAAPEDAHGSRRTNGVQVSTAGITCDHSGRSMCLLLHPVVVSMAVSASCCYLGHQMLSLELPMNRHVNRTQFGRFSWSLRLGASIPLENLPSTGFGVWGTLCSNKSMVFYFFLMIWRFPKIVVPPNHPFEWTFPL